MFVVTNPVYKIYGFFWLVTVPNQHVLREPQIRPENREKIWSRIKNIAEKRGFRLTSNLTAEAYGECMSVCVKNAAANMHGAAQMNSPITIRAELTDYNEDSGSRQNLPESTSFNFDFDKTQEKPSIFPKIKWWKGK